MNNLKLPNLPKCPKCKKGNLVPLSEAHETWGGRDFCNIYAKWKCTNCKHEVEYD